MVHALGGNAHQFKGNRSDRSRTASALYPGHHILDATAPRWWEPSLRARTMGETGLPIARLAFAPTTPLCPSCVKRFLHVLAPLGQLCGQDHCAGCIVEDRTTSRFAARVHLDPQWRRPGMRFRLLENDGEWISPKHCCFLLCQ